VLGDKWAAAVVPFTLICFILPLKALWPILSPAVAAVGRPHVNLATIAVMASSMIAAMLIGVRYGVIGVCYAWLTVYPIVFALTTSRRLEAVGVKVSQYFSELVFPFFASLAMFVLIVLGHRVFGTARPMYDLAGTVVFGVVFYVSLVLIFERQRYAELRSMLR
jgi:O-antigen/teichoic acid export membrane protein